MEINSESYVQGDHSGVKGNFFIKIGRIESSTCSTKKNLSLSSDKTTSNDINTIYVEQIAYLININQTNSLQPENYILIESINECIRVVETILLYQSIIALDCEGVFLSKEGRLTLMQIGLIDGRVFLFDILKGGSLMFLGLNDNKRGLKAVLENKKILKLVHDCRNDWDSLLYQYSVRLYNFADTQEAYYIFKLFYYQEVTLPISLLKLVETFTGNKLEYKSKFKNNMINDPSLWSNRPLDKESLQYASEDVRFLIQTWKLMTERFNTNLMEIVFFLSILKVVDFIMFEQFKDYLFSNIIYFGMLENVFDSKSLYSYIFALDYVYNFLQIKNIVDKKKSTREALQEEETFKICDSPNDRNYSKENELNQVENNIIKTGICFKEMQRGIKVNNTVDKHRQYGASFLYKKYYNKKLIIKNQTQQNTDLCNPTTEQVSYFSNNIAENSNIIRSNSPFKKTNYCKIKKHNEILKSNFLENNFTLLDTSTSKQSLKQNKIVNDFRKDENLFKSNNKLKSKDENVTLSFADYKSKEFKKYKKNYRSKSGVVHSQTKHHDNLMDFTTIYNYNDTYSSKRNSK